MDVTETSFLVFIALWNDFVWPVLVIFLSLQKYYVAGVASTGARN